MKPTSGLYDGRVTHCRLRPKRHRLAYNVFCLLLDLDELPDLDRQLRLFGHNRAAPVAFHDRDHGDGTPGGLRRWIDARLADAGLDLNGGAVRLLCYPRLFGYVFNPLSTYFCYDAGGTLRAILYEVSNTFGERHTYVIPASGGEDKAIVQACDKRFHVSPFLPMACTYRFRILPPSETVGIAIHEKDADGLLLTASFHGEYAPLSDGQLLKRLIGFPLMTMKIMAAIHWEALKLYLKRIPIVRHRPAAQAVDATIVAPARASD